MGRASEVEEVVDLPAGITACLFDLDGVLTRTATVHAAAWKAMFDDFLRGWSARHGEPFVAFDRHTDYDTYVDGLPRLDGVRTFLASRGIELPAGSTSDPPGADTVHGLGLRKNDLVSALIERQGVEAYAGSVRFVEAARRQGLRRAVVSSSTNAEEVLVAAGIAELVEERVDGLVADREGLRGKPAPDTFLAGARLLGVGAQECAIFEDAQAGVQAGRAGAFGWVVGVDRTGQAGTLRRLGADVVVEDLAELLVRP